MKAENHIGLVAIPDSGRRSCMFMMTLRVADSPDRFNYPVAEPGPRAARVWGLGQKTDGLERRRRSDAGTGRDGKRG